MTRKSCSEILKTTAWLFAVSLCLKEGSTEVCTEEGQHGEAEGGCELCCRWALTLFDIK